MKRSIALLLILTLMMSLVACGSEKEPEAQTEEVAATVETETTEEETTEQEKTIEPAYTAELGEYELLAADMVSFWRVGEDVEYQQTDFGFGLSFWQASIGKDDYIAVDVGIEGSPDIEEFVKKYNEEWPEEQYEPAELLGMPAYKRPSSSYPNMNVYVLEYEGVSGALLTVKISRGPEADDSTIDAFVQAIFDNMIFRAKQ